MDFSKLTQGERISGIAGLALFLSMIIFKWFGLKAGVSGFSAEVTRNAWGAYGFFDFILFITAVAAIALPLLRASGNEVSLPVALSAIVAGLGILSVVLIIISIISPPNFADVSLPSGVDKTRKIGAFIGLLCAAGVAYGGWAAMQEEGTSFGEQRGRLREPGDGPDNGPGAAPPAPPPPPPDAPPPGP